MDTGLKKLWSRRKSSGNDVRKDSGPEQINPSSTTSPRSNLLHNNERFQSSQSTTSRPPPLLSTPLFSRPSTGRSQSANDGGSSMLKAVHRAGDAVAKAEQEVHHSADRCQKQQVQPRDPPRHIDIFSLSSPSSAIPRTGYNEEVAERNLDLTRVALDSGHEAYVPSSKYQEEVAARNARPRLVASPRGSQTGSDAILSLSQLRVSMPSPTRRPRLQQRSQQSPSAERGHRTNDSAGLHSRQQSEESGQSYVRRPQLQSRTESAASDAPAGALSNYLLSSSEKTGMRNSATSSNIQTHHDPRRPSPTHSNTSSLKRTINLHNRTIMDLTGDEPEASGEIIPAENAVSPPIEQSPAEGKRRQRDPATPGSVEERLQAKSRSGEPTVVPPPRRHILSPAEITRNRVPALEPVLEPLKSTNSPATTRSINTFTPIITIASASPRTSIIMEKTIDEQHVEHEVTMREAQSREFHELATDSTPPRKKRSSDNQRQTTEADNRVKDEQTKVTTAPVLRSEKPDNVRFAEANPLILEEKHVVQNNEPIPANGPYIHMPSDISILGAASTTGVSTRDFATTAAKPTLTSVPEDAELTAIEGESLSPQSPFRKSDANGVAHDVSNYQSTFDEVKFAQKQADARDALVRLQLSLNEDFLSQTSPGSAAVSNGSSPSKHSHTFSDGKPATPSSVHTKPRESVHDTTDARNSKASKPEYVEGPYRHLTTATQDETIGQGRDPSSMRWKNNAGKKRERGKRRVDVDLNGPGPSIINEPPTHSLPLPPPLRLVQDPFVERDPVVPPSPGEISLSHFPIPVSSPRRSIQSAPGHVSTRKERYNPRPSLQTSPQHQLNSYPGPREQMLRRKSSTNSQSSHTSAFSLPFHMIPDRSSSTRDRSVREDNEN